VRVQEGRGRARDVIASGCIQYRECTQVYFSSAVYIYIYILLVVLRPSLHCVTATHLGIYKETPNNHDDGATFPIFVLVSE
jgi:hypothetical protein